MLLQDAAAAHHAGSGPRPHDAASFTFAPKPTRTYVIFNTASGRRAAMKDSKYFRARRDMPCARLLGLAAAFLL